MTSAQPQRLTDYYSVDLLVERTASGGFGLVFMGPDHLDQGQWKAMKTMKPEMLNRPGVHDLFIREALTWTGIWPHANVLQPQGIIEINILPFLVLEYAKHGNLRQMLQIGQSFETRLIWAQMVAAGLDALHTPDPAMLRPHPIVHRDLKPENVLITENGYAKITDFGLSKVVDAATQGADILPEASRSSDPTQTQAYHTQRGVAMGTPLYMAHEQWEDAASAGPPADIYAFGQILSELLAGRLAVQPKAGQSWREAHQHPQPRSLREVVPALPQALDEVYLACFQVDPHQRPTAPQLMAALQASAQAMGVTVYIVEERMERTPENEAALWGNWAAAYRRFGLYHEALERIDFALACDPQDANNLLTRGNILFNLQRYAEAHASYDASIAAFHDNPDQRVPLNMRGNTLQNLGRYAEADTSYTRSLEIDPNNAGFWSNRGGNARRWGEAEAIAGNREAARQQYQTALGFFDRAIALNPHNPGYRNNRAITVQALGQLDTLPS